MDNLPIIISDSFSPRVAVSRLLAMCILVWATKEAILKKSCTASKHFINRLSRYSTRESVSSIRMESGSGSSRSRRSRSGNIGTRASSDFGRVVVTTAHRSGSSLRRNEIQYRKGDSSEKGKDSHRRLVISRRRSTTSSSDLSPSATSSSTSNASHSTRLTHRRGESTSDSNTTRRSSAHHRRIHRWHSHRRHTRHTHRRHSRHSHSWETHRHSRLTETGHTRHSRHSSSHRRHPWHARHTRHASSHHHHRIPSSPIHLLEEFRHRLRVEGGGRSGSSVRNVGLLLLVIVVVIVVVVVVLVVVLLRVRWHSVAGLTSFSLELRSLDFELSSNRISIDEAQRNERPTVCPSIICGPPFNTFSTLSTCS